MDPTPEENLKKTRKWKENIANLLFRRNVCGICLKTECELTDWNSICLVEFGGVEKSLKNIIESSFLEDITNLLPTSEFCEECVSVILSTYLFVRKICSNHNILQKYFSIINEQIDLGAGTELQTEKHLMLTIDNVESLNVPTTVTEKSKETQNVTQIFLCEVDNIDFDSELYDTVNCTAKYECPYCGKNYKDYDIFKEHHKRHNERFYRCYRCGKRFRHFDELISHRKDTHLDKLSTCDLCKIILLNPNSTEHIDEHNSLFVCYVCQINFGQKQDLDDHVMEKHTEVTCQNCFKNFDNSLKLDHHRCLFKCRECQDNCVHEDYLASYREQHIANQAEFKCRDCDFKYSMRSQLICHVNEEHLKYFPYLCDLCGESFASKPYLTSHNYRKHADVSHIFDKSPKGITAGLIIDGKIGLRCATDQLNSNLCKEKDSITKISTECPYCDKAFHSLKLLNAHIKEEHSEEIYEQVEIYQCSMCSLDFITENDLQTHASTHPEGSKHICRECNASFSQANLFNSHMKKHTAKYDKQCPICLKKYTKFTIQRHLRLHHEEKQKDLKDTDSSICEVCSKSFDSEKSLMKHAIMHKEVKQCSMCLKKVNGAFLTKHINTHLQAQKTLKQCSYCKYTTKFTTCLEAHINRHHLKTRPYECDICQKTFFSDYTLRGHKLTHKEVRPEHYCHICGSKFISKKALTLHTRLHTGETPYPCEFCDLSFISASRRRQHMIRKHFEPSVECNLCNKKFFTKSDLKRHISDCHYGDTKRKRAQKDYEVVVDLENDQEVEQEVISTTQPR